MPISPAAVRDLLRLVQDGRRLLGEAGEGTGPLCCPTCNTPASLDGAFCHGCGLRLRFPCPQCQGGCVAGARFCAHCGQELSAQVVGAQVERLQRQVEDERARKERDLLRRYTETRVVDERRVRHLIGVLPDGRREFVKVAMDKAGRQLVECELAALRAIGDHPGVVRLIEHRDQGDALVAVFEHLDSAPMRFPLAIATLLALIARTLEILQFVHEKGLIHGDLKPAHLLLRTESDPVIIDWNVAQTPGPSRFGAFTPMFAAPEQIVGDHVDHSADLYAVGVILYLLFTHDRFPAVLEEKDEAENMLAVLNARKAGNRAFLSERTVYKGKLAALQLQEEFQHAQRAGNQLEERRVLGAKYLFSEELSRTHTVNADIRLTGDILAVVQRATAVDPRDRYADAAAMKAAVDAIRGRLGQGAPAGADKSEARDA